MSSLQEHMERGFLDQYERYSILNIFLRALGFDPETVQKVSVAPYTISVTVKTGPDITTTTDLGFRPWKEAPTT